VGCKEGPKHIIAIYVHLGPHNVIATSGRAQTERSEVGIATRVAIHVVLNGPYNILFGESLFIKGNCVCGT
jgi:hypothetical protein